MNINYKLHDGPEIDPAVSEAIIRNAREAPMTVVYIDDNDNTALGNSEVGFRYYDSNGAQIPREIAEPFRLAGIGLVINHGLLEADSPAE